MVPLLIHEKGCPVEEKKKQEGDVRSHHLGEDGRQEEEERMAARKSPHQARTRPMLVAYLR